MAENGTGVVLHIPYLTNAGYFNRRRKSRVRLAAGLLKDEGGSMLCIVLKKEILILLMLLRN